MFRGVDYQNCAFPVPRKLKTLPFAPGPTTFKPLIHQTIELVEKHRGYHVLFIMCDGQVTHERETIEAIVQASLHPISIVCVGVGDGARARSN